MLVVREVFTARPGMASRPAELLRDSLHDDGVRVLTDLVADFSTVVLETQVENLSGLEERFETYMNDASLKERMKGYTDLRTEARREIHQVM